MNVLRYPRPAVVWAILVGMTIISFQTAESRLSPRLSALLLFGVAAIKAWLVMLHYMETAHAAPQWQWFYPVWAGGLAVLLMIGHAL